MRVAKARELLRDDLHRLLPRPFAKRLVPVGGCGNAIARVAERTVDHRQPAQWIELRARLVRLRLVLDLPPWPTAPSPSLDLRRVRLESPLTVALHPSLPNQGFRQAIAVDNEVGAEAALHASRAHVGRRLFDPWAVHTHDIRAANLEVDLTPDTAVRAYAAHG